MQEHPESTRDAMVFFHVNKREWIGEEELPIIDLCEILFKEDWVQVDLTPWVDELEQRDVVAVEVDGTQKMEVLPEGAFLENPLQIKTTSTRIMVGEDVKDYPHVPVDWYRHTMEQAHIAESNWKVVEIQTGNSKVRQMRMGNRVDEKEMRAHVGLVEEFSDIFAWLYKSMKYIASKLVQHQIPLIPGAKPIRQKEWRMNTQLQLIFKAKL